MRKFVKGARSTDMNRGNKVLVIISSKDAKELFEKITAELRKENRRRGNDMSYEIFCEERSERWRKKKAKKSKEEQRIRRKLRYLSDSMKHNDKTRKELEDLSGYMDIIRFDDPAKPCFLKKWIGEIVKNTDKTDSSIAQVCVEEAAELAEREEEKKDEEWR